MTCTRINKKILLLACTLTVTGVMAQENQQPVCQENLTFDTYLNRVGKKNLEYLANRLNVDIANAEIVAAKVLPDPSVDFEAGNETFTLGLSYSVEMGKRWARIKLARSQRDWEKLALEQNFQDLRADAAELYLDAILQRELLRTKESSYQYMAQLSQSDSLRYVHGELEANDARQSHLEAISLLNEVYDQEAAYQAALIELNRFMGTTADTLYIPAGNWEELKRDFKLDDLLQIGLVNRVDLMAAVKNVEVNNRAYKLARAERRPDIDVSVSYERDWDHFLPQARYVTLGVSVPLAFSAINKGSRKSAKLQTLQVTYQQQDMELQVQSDIRQSWYTYQAEGKKVQQYQSGVMDESRKVMDGMFFKYKRGEASILDLLVAQRTYNETCQDYLETLKGYVSSLVQLEKSCGIWDIHF